jgi:hypothetical protein
MHFCHISFQLTILVIIAGHEFLMKLLDHTKNHSLCLMLVLLDSKLWNIS